MRVTRLVTTLSLAALMFAGRPLAADDDDRQGGEGKPRFEAELLRIADLNVPNGNPAGQQLGPAFGPNGTDPLQEGSVEVRNEGRVDISVRGAAASQSYTVFFCRFGFGPAGCVMVGTAGALATDSRGDGSVRLDFPQPASANSSWAGAFILTRVVSGQPTNEFVSGFRIRPPENPNQAEVQIEGQVSSINGGNQSFRVGSFQQDIFTDNATQFRGGLRRFADLTIGMRVEVKARTNNGQLLAREVEGKGPESNPSRGRGRGRD